MALVNKNTETAIAMLEEKLEKCVSEETEISMHVITNGSTISNSGKVEEFDLTKDCLYLVCGWFYLEIKDIVDIQYVDDNLVDIFYSDGELDLDLE